MNEPLNTTIITPLALVITCIAGILMFALPRRYTILPLAAVFCFITEQQRIVVAGFDFTMIRIMLLLGFARIVSKKEFSGFVLSKIDYAILLYVASGTIIYIVRWGEFGAFANRLGFVVNSLGIYFFLRAHIRDGEDIKRVLRIMSVIVMVVAIFMVVESLTGRNHFSVFGGVPEFTEMRSGRRRCQGAFEHPLLAGAFGSTMIPLFTILIRNRGFNAVLGCAGILGGILMTLTSASSGPILSLIAAFIGMLLWPLRWHMAWVRRGIVLTIIALQATMAAPVYALVARFKLVGGSTGYHRFALIDQFFRRFGEWWLLGTRSTSHWGFGLWDVTNYYIAEAVKGGLLTLVLLLSIIVYAYKYIGRSLRMSEDDVIMQKNLWSLGVALLAHLTAFWGMNYFGAQIFLNWYFLLVAIGVFSASAEGPATPSVELETGGVG